MKRLPNNFGSVSKLSGTRSKPYMARTSEGKVIGYAKTRQDAIILLSDYNKNPWDIEGKKATVEDVWNLFVDQKINKFSESRRKGFISAYKKYISELKDKIYAGLRTYHFTLFLDALDCTDNMKNLIVSLLKHFDDIAFEYEIIDKKYAHELKTITYKQKHQKKPFTEDEIKLLWEHVNEEDIPDILILLYTGFRRSEYVDIKLENIDLENWIIVGGKKTKAGFNRRVPIHPRIRPLVLEKIKSGEWYRYSDSTLNERLKRKLKTLGMDHTTHECRHTLRTRLDRVGANKVCIDRILGHKSGEVGEDVYTHKSDSELNDAIALID